jgi:hypothetical protein
MRLMFPVLLLLWIQAPASGPAEGDVAFRWALAATSAAQGGKLIPLTGTTVLKAGDELRLLLEPKCQCFFFVLFESAQRELTVLVPSPDATGAPLEPGRALTTRVEGQRLRLDDRAGLETVHLIASATPLPELVSLLTTYRSSLGDRRASLATGVLAEIRSLKLRHMNARAVERPLSVAGRTRGPSADLLSLALSISARSFYSRTYTIDHR